MTYRSGLNNVAEYQASGYPWVTSSNVGSSAPVRIDFPYVTSKLYIQNRGGGPLAVGFTLNGTNGTNRYEIPVSQSLTAEIKTNVLYLMGVGATVNYSLMVGLTGILRDTYPVLTGSAASGSLQLSYGFSGSIGSNTGLG